MDHSKLSHTVSFSVKLWLEYYICSKMFNIHWYYHSSLINMDHRSSHNKSYGKSQSFTFNESWSFIDGEKLVSIHNKSYGKSLSFTFNKSQSFIFNKSYGKSLSFTFNKSQSSPKNLNHSPSINLDHHSSTGLKTEFSKAQINHDHSSTKGYPALAGKDRRVDGEKLVSTQINLMENLYYSSSINLNHLQ